MNLRNTKTNSKTYLKIINHPTITIYLTLIHSKGSGVFWYQKINCAEPKCHVLRKLLGGFTTKNEMCGTKMSRNVTECYENVTKTLRFKRMFAKSV